MTKTKFLGVRKPTAKEKKETEADLVFIREDYTGKEVLIFVDRPTKDYSWSQWGQNTDILGENVDAIERYFKIK